MLSVADALAIILSRAAALPPVGVPAAEALGRTLAEDVASDIDSPPWDKSLMDGYALIAADAVPGAALEIIEEVTAGKVPTREVTRGTATRIMTGAPLPPGADAVVMIEKTELAANHRVVIQTEVKTGQNILRRAASMRRGEVVLPRGQIVRPIETGILAEVGRTEVSVVGRPRVAIIATGDELVDASVTPLPGQIRNSNGPMLAALVAASGAEAISLGIARDDAAALTETIARGLEADVLVLSGGVSAGVVDLVPPALQSLGVEELFHKVNLKPGKPLWFGMRGATLVFGLPGNPVSTLVCFGLFVKPALAKLMGRNDAAQARLAALTADFQQRDARPTYFPARLSLGREGDTITPLAWRGSADLRALADANALAHFPGGERTFAAGERVQVFEL